MTSLGEENFVFDVSIFKNQGLFSDLIPSTLLSWFLADTGHWTSGLFFFTYLHSSFISWTFLYLNSAVLFSFLLFFFPSKLVNGPLSY